MTEDKKKNPVETVKELALTVEGYFNFSDLWKSPPESSIGSS